VASRLTATKTYKPSQNFVEGIFDALTSYKRFLLTPFLHTPSHLAFIESPWPVSVPTAPGELF